MRVMLDEKRHELPNWCPLELGVQGSHHLGDSLWRNGRVSTSEAFHQLGQKNRLVQDIGHSGRLSLDQELVNKGESIRDTQRLAAGRQLAPSRCGQLQWPDVDVYHGAAGARDPYHRGP